MCPSSYSKSCRPSKLISCSGSYPSDDINKFLWMVRIGGGEFPEIKEKDYMGSDGQYKVDSTMSKVCPLGIRVLG